MNPKKTITSLLFALFLFNALYAQENNSPCSFEESQDEFYKANPDALEQAKKFEQKVKEDALLKKNGLMKSANSYVVPVVFHVYGNNWPDDSEGNNREVTVERIKQSLQKINDDFKGGNDPIDPFFSNIEGSMDIEFRLAQIDPDGNTTNGVVFHETKEGFGLNGTNDHEIAKYAWDNYKYFNIHLQLVLKSGGQNNSGIAWFPSTGMSDEGSARVVYNGKYIIYSPPASSLTHEFGHFFGLEHTFNGGCVLGDDNGDLVGDTPPTSAGAGCDPGTKNCFNQTINSQNHMDYNPCESMFTKGQVTRMESYMDHPARVTLWQPSNLVATGIDEDLGARVLFNYQSRNDSDIDKSLALSEDFNNSGGIVNKRRIKAIDGAQFATIGILQEGVHYTTSGIPNGLNARINITDSVSGEITLVGQANNHEESDSSSFTITLLNPAIVGGTNAIFSTTGTYKVSFIDDYEVYYETFSPTILKAIGQDEDNVSYITDFSSTASINGALKVRLVNYDGTLLGVNNPSKSLELLCNNDSINISYLPEGSSIGVNSSGTWLSGVTTQTAPATLTSASYSNWHGRTGYFGFRTKTVTGSYLYGWMKATVSNDGRFGKIISMAVNPDIGNSITANIEKPHVTYSKDRFLESVSNDGSMENDIIVDLKSDTFSVAGNMEAGIHYTIANVPNGLQFRATVLNNRRVRLSMLGNSTLPSDEWEYHDNIKFKFLDTAFSSNDASQILFSEFTLNLEHLGDSFSKSLNDSEFVVSDPSSGTGSFAVLSSHVSIDRQIHIHQMQNYVTGDYLGIKFISWRKDAIANDDYELTPLNAGDIIGPDSSWKNGQEYYSGRGQHMIDSDSYQAWRGKTKYVGIRIVRSERTHYGWIKLRVSNGGSSFEFEEYAISGIPETPIKAGTLQTGEGDGEPDEYCVTNGNSGPEAISLVEFAGIENASGRNENGYEYFSNQTATVGIGTSNNLKVTIVGYQDGSNDEIYSWFDWNQDGDFNDPGEYKELSKNSGTTGQVIISVPEDAVLGTTRMRLRVAYYPTSAVPCDFMEYGEVEDYNVNVTTDGEGNPGLVYCDASGIKGPEAITEVNFSEIENTSSRSISGYEDFTNETNANLTIGSTNSLNVTITPYQDGTNDEIYAWFDWNQDGDFEDEGEFTELNKTSGTTGQISIAVPQDAAIGTTRMRLRVAYYPASAVPCGNMNYGEVEDYGITISSFGKIASSNVEKSNADTDRINVYPNPMSQERNTLNIDFNTEEEGMVKIEIYNVTGKKVFELTEEKRLETVKTIKLDNRLPTGLYLLKTRIGETGNDTITKIIVN